MHRPNKTKNPGFIREYYDYEFGGHYSSSRVTRGDGVKALLQNAWNAQWSHNRYRLLYPSTMGDAVWSMYDYNRGCCDNICYSGVADLFRLPKYSRIFSGLRWLRGLRACREGETGSVYRFGWTAASGGNRSPGRIW